MACPGRRYAAQCQNACAATVTTNMTLISTAAVRPGIYYFNLGASGTPADNALQWVFQRITTTGTVTSNPTPALDPADPTSTTTSGKTATIEPTYTASTVVFRAALNQRATLQWFADQNGAILMPATASNGIGMSAVHASFSGNVDLCAHFYE